MEAGSDFRSKSLVSLDESGEWLVATRAGACGSVEIAGALGAAFAVFPFFFLVFFAIPGAEVEFGVWVVGGVPTS